MSDNEIIDKINLIIGQTAYTFEEAKHLLSLCDNDEFLVIRNYLRSDPVTTIITNDIKQTESKNQLIYKEIRKFMDGCNKNNNNK
jgi:hypothetical protein